MDIIAIKRLMQFMQSHDPNGSWTEWYKEIRLKQSTFDREYVITVLNEWYNDSGNMVYKDMAAQVKNM
jgi:hypothetical protein